MCVKGQLTLFLLCFNSAFGRNIFDKEEQAEQEERLNEINNNVNAWNEATIREYLKKAMKLVDTNKDGKIDGRELAEWVHIAHKDKITSDVHHRWGFYERYLEGINYDKGLDWTMYRAITFPESEVKKHQRRFEAADENKDGILSREEFQKFLYPQESPDLKRLVAQEAIDQVDIDGDGKISFTEYVNYYRFSQIVDATKNPGGKHMNESDYLALFNSTLDKNHDNFIDVDEILDWMSGQGSPHAATVYTVLNNHDHDYDNKLSEEEITKYPLNLQFLLFSDLFDPSHDEL